jgi:hypothetical protein
MIILFFRFLWFFRLYRFGATVMSVVWVGIPNFGIAKIVVDLNSKKINIYLICHVVSLLYSHRNLLPIYYLKYF